MKSSSNDLLALGRRLTALLATALAGSYLLTVLQPVSLWMTVKGATADFPCAGHGCGCQTAAQCQADCCCFPKAIVAPAKKSCCAAKEAPEPAVVVEVSGCTGGEAIVESGVKRVIPIRLTELPVRYSEAEAAYGFHLVASLKIVDAEVPSPVPIFS